MREQRFLPCLKPCYDVNKEFPVIKKYLNRNKCIWKLIVKTIKFENTYEIIEV